MRFKELFFFYQTYSNIINLAKYVDIIMEKFSAMNRLNICLQFSEGWDEGSK